MAKKSDRKTVIFPSGDPCADCAWAARIGQRDLALFWQGDVERLMDTLQTITAKRDRTNVEMAYLSSVFCEPYRED